MISFLPMESVPEIPQKPAEQNKNIFQKRSYEIGDIKVKVSWKEFFPTDHEAPNGEAVLFLTGWSAGTAKTLEDLSQNFANDGKKNTLLITTRPEKVAPNSLYTESEAIKNLIVEKDLRKITIASHSEGGIKSANLIDILQKESPDIEIQGLILLDPVGLYEQNWAKFASQFALDTTINTPITLAKNFLKDPSLALKGIEASSDIIFNIAREIATTGPKEGTYLRKLYLQVKEMAKKNTHYQDVKCPVILVQGTQDPVSSPEKVVPAAQNPKSISGRSAILKSLFFPNSPRVYMIGARKLGHHGVPHFRGKSISGAAFYLLGRSEREQASLGQSPDPTLQVD